MTTNEKWAVNGFVAMSLFLALGLIVSGIQLRAVYKQLDAANVSVEQLLNDNVAGQGTIAILKTTVAAHKTEVHVLELELTELRGTYTRTSNSDYRRELYLLKLIEVQRQENADLGSYNRKLAGDIEFLHSFINCAP